MSFLFSPGKRKEKKRGEKEESPDGISYFKKGKGGGVSILTIYRKRGIEEKEGEEKSRAVATLKGRLFYPPR